jgi:hypothetical protein
MQAAAGAPDHPDRPPTPPHPFDTLTHSLWCMLFCLQPGSDSKKQRLASTADVAAAPAGPGAAEAAAAAIKQEEGSTPPGGLSPLPDDLVSKQEGGVSCSRLKARWVMSMGVCDSSILSCMSVATAQLLHSTAHSSVICPWLTVF